MPTKNRREDMCSRRFAARFDGFLRRPFNQQAPYSRREDAQDNSMNLLEILTCELQSAFSIEV